MSRVGGIVSYLGGHRRVIGATVAASLLSTAIVVAAVQSDGSTATNVQLDDGAVWVTNDEQRLVGRLNVRIDEFDFAINGSAEPDVLQDGRTVLFSGRNGGVQRLDVRTGDPTAPNDIPVTEYEIGGGIGAVLNPEDGTLWVGADSTVVAPEFPDKPDALVEPGARLVVTPAVTFLDVDGQEVTRGKVIVIESGGWREVHLGDDLEPLREGYGEVADTTVPTTEPPTTTVAPGDGEAIEEADPEPLLESGVHLLPVDPEEIDQVSAVGAMPVVLTTEGEVVWTREDGAAAEVRGDAWALQQPASDADEVLVASDEGLYAVALADGTVTELAATEGAPAAPVRVGPCVYGAWSSDTPEWFKQCDGSDPIGPAPIPGAAAGAELVFRVNQRNVALNRPDNGDVWADHEGTLSFVGNWDDVKPDDEEEEQEQETTGESEVEVERECRRGGSRPPVANDDQLGVRPRPSVIDLLNNDDDVNCEPLAIASLTPDHGDWGSLTVVDNGQHVLYSPSEEYLTGAAEQGLSFTFEYTVADPAGNESAPAEASVLVRDRTLGNTPPALRPKGDGTREMHTVVEEGKQVAYDVMPDWWDPDGDDLRLESAVPLTAGDVVANPDGVVTFRAFGVGPGVYDVEVTMSDGFDSWTETLEATVKPAGSAIPPVPADDFITLSVGQTGTVDPLANDSDGNGSELSLVPGWPTENEGYQARVLAGDVVEITADQPGVYQLDYSASDGTDAEPAAIRLEVRGPAELNTAPVAVPDKVTLRPYRIVNVEVLGNDVDLDGDLLGVIDVDVPAGDPEAGEVRATIIDRRMLQVEVVAGRSGVAPVGPFDIRYRVTDGRDDERAAAGATADERAADLNRGWGTVTILIQPPGVDQPPVAADDTAVVRTGNIVGVPVMRNDTDPDADEIELTRITPDSLAKFEADGGGVAWVAGHEVMVWGATPRFEPYTLSYEIVAGDRPATGILSVTVTDEPDDGDNQNRLPEPPDLVLRAVRNAAVRLQMPTSGVDPDGDSVALHEVGLPAAAQHGTTVSVDEGDPDVLVYRAGSNAPANDTFTYKVRDPYDGVAEATVQVLVLDQQDWPPQGHDDVWRARPGRTLQIPVLANDVSPQDLPIRLAELPFFDADGQPSAEPLNAGNVTLPDQSDPTNHGFVTVEVPDSVGTLVEQYRIVDEGDRNGKAAIRITPDPEAPNMLPVAEPDTDLRPADLRDRSEVSIDVLANDYDPDGDSAHLQLEVAALQPEGVRVEGSQLVVPILDRVQRVLYRITDADGDSTVGFAVVPGHENHPPQLSEMGADPNARLIEAANPSPLRIELSDVVVDPDGDTDIRLTDTEIRLAEGAPGEIRRTGETAFEYLPPPELSETTTVFATFEVTDRPDLSSDERLTTPRCNCLATLAIGVVIEAQSPPVAVGPGAVSLPQLDEEEFLDVTALSYDPEDDLLTYEFDSSTFGGLEVLVNGPRLTLVSRLDGDQLLPVGHTIPIRYTVSDGTFDPVPSVVNVTISTTNKPPPVAGSVGRFDDVERDVTYDGIPNLIAAASNPFPDRPLTLIESSVDAPGQLTCSPDGSCTFVTAAVGSYTATYTLEDAAQRTVQGTFQLGVKGKPLAPGEPEVVSVGDHVVNLRWDAADDQGAPISTYHLTATGEDGSSITKTTDSTSFAFDGLTNDVGYTFTVVAENELGEGEVSGASSVGRPDRVPDPPVGLAFTDYGDGTLSLTWEAPPSAGDFSAITDYEVEIGGRSIPVPGGSQTDLLVDGLTNGQAYTFKVRAKNNAGTNGGWGAWSAVGAGSGTQEASGTPSRYPDPPGQPVGVNSGDGGDPRITVTWAAPGYDGGRSVEQYEVCRVGGECQTVPAATRQATFPAGRGQESSFIVVAFNSDKNRNNSDPSPTSAPVVAVGNPDPPTVTVSSGDHTVSASASGPNNSGCSSQSFQYRIRSAGGSWSGWSATNSWNDRTNGTAYEVQARAILPDSCGTPGVQYVSSESNTASTTPYGPLRTPSISASGGGTTTITWNWATNRADDGRPGWRATLSGDCGSATLSTAPGATGSVSKSYSRDGSTRSCTITVSADGQPSITRTASAKVQDPPPTTATVTVPPPDRTCPEKDFTGPSNWNDGACGGEGAGFIAVGTSMVVSCRRNITYGGWNPWLRIQSGGPGAGWYVAAGTVTGNWSGLPTC